jgi:NADPH-dependent 7-cyano-7-deazaguanine reductase QueF
MTDGLTEQVSSRYISYQEFAAMQKAAAKKRIIFEDLFRMTMPHCLALCGKNVFYDNGGIMEGTTKSITRDALYLAKFILEEYNRLNNDDVAI